VRCKRCGFDALIAKRYGGPAPPFCVGDQPHDFDFVKPEDAEPMRCRRCQIADTEFLTEHGCTEGRSHDFPKPGEVVKCNRCGFDNATKGFQFDVGTRCHLLGAHDFSRPEDPPLHQFASGAKSSRVMNFFDLIPRAALRLLSDRFKLGAELRGEEWSHRKGVNDDAFVRDRINHMIDHAFAYAEHRKEEDLGAVLCNAAMLADIAELRKA
jgi:hypothetical protein